MARTNIQPTLPSRTPHKCLNLPLASWWLALMLILLVLYVTYGHSLLFLGKTLAPIKGNPWLDPGASYWANAATAKLINLLLGRGELPLWADQIGIGVPLFSDPHNAFFSPFSFILYAFPTSRGWDAMMLIRLFTLIFSSYLLFSRLLSKGKNQNQAAVFIFSLFAAILFGYSGHVFYFLNLFHLNSLAIAPLFLLGAIETLEKNFTKGLFLLAIAMTLMIFGGGLLDVVLVAVLLVFIVLAYFFQRLSRLSSALTNMAWLGLFSLLALLLSAIFILPYIELRSISIGPYKGRSLAVFNSYWYSLSLFFHELTITPENASNYYMKFRQYLHIVALPGLLYSLSLLTKKRCHFSYVFIGMWCYLFFFIAKLHGVEWLTFINDLPILQDIRFNKYQGVFHLTVYALSAAGLLAAFTDKGWHLRLFALVVFLIAITLPYAYLNQQGITIGYKAHFYAGLLIALLALLFWHWLSASWQAKKPVSQFNLITICASILLSAQIFIDFNPARADLADLFPQTEQRKAMLSIVKDERIMPLYGAGPRVWSADGLYDVRNFSVVFSERYRSLFKNRIERKACWHFLILCSDEADTINLPLLSLLGTKYLLVKDDQLEALAKNPYKQHRLIQHKNDSNIIELQNPIPLVSFSNQVHLMSEKDLKTAFTREKLNLPKHIFIEDPAALAVQLASQDSNKTEIKAKNTITTLSKSNGRISFQIKSNQAGILVLNKQYFPGWQAYIDDKKTRLFRANYLFQGINIPAGTHTVEFVFFPNTLRLGMVLGALALLIMFLLRQRFKRA